jgi:hypothetical protein
VDTVGAAEGGDAAVVGIAAGVSVGASLARQRAIPTPATRRPSVAMAMTATTATPRPRFVPGSFDGGTSAEDAVIPPKLCATDNTAVCTGAGGSTAVSRAGST